MAQRQRVLRSVTAMMRGSSRAIPGGDMPFLLTSRQVYWFDIHWQELDSLGQMITYKSSLYSLKFMILLKYVLKRQTFQWKMSITVSLVVFTARGCAGHIHQQAQPVPDNLPLHKPQWQHGQGGGNSLTRHLHRHWAVQWDCVPAQPWPRLQQGWQHGNGLHLCVEPWEVEDLHQSPRQCILGEHRYIPDLSITDISLSFLWLLLKTCFITVVI